MLFAKHVICWLFSCICVLTRQNKESLKYAHIILFGLLNLVLFKHAGSYIRYVLYSYMYLFSSLKRRHPVKNEYVIYRARSVRMRKTVHSFFPYGPPAR